MIIIEFGIKLYPNAHRKTIDAIFERRRYLGQDYKAQIVTIVLSSHYAITPRGKTTR